MKRILIIWALLISICFAQSKAGFYVVGGKIITVQDTSSRKYLKAIEGAGVVPSVTQNFASNYLVTSEKAISTWTLMKAQYPFIGGTAATHKFNLNDPRDLDVAYRLTFGGTLTHSANGMQGDGSTGYANTFLAPTDITGTGFSLSFYTNQNLASSSVEYVMGASNGGAGSGGTNNSLIIRRSNNSSIFLTTGFLASPNNRVDAAVTDSRGYTIGSTTASTSKLFQKGIQIGSNTSFTPNTKDSNSIYLLAYNNNNSLGSTTDKPCQLASIGSGLTDQQAIQQSRAVTSFEGFLGRQ